MRTKILILLASFLMGVAHGQDHRSFQRVILNDSLAVRASVDSNNVRCSHIGYGMAELKISLPELRHRTLFDHSNIGETEPCMTAGLCAQDDWGMPGLRPDDLLQGNPGLETMTIDREVVESFFINMPLQSCSRSLTENLRGELRGLEFTHQVIKAVGLLPIEECLELEATL